MAKQRTANEQAAGPAEVAVAPDVPVEAPTGLPDGYTLGEPELVEPGGYEERPYDAALTDEHRAVLQKADQLP